MWIGFFFQIIEMTMSEEFSPSIRFRCILVLLPLLFALHTHCRAVVMKSHVSFLLIDEIFSAVCPG